MRRIAGAAAAALLALAAPAQALEPGAGLAAVRPAAPEAPGPLQHPAMRAFRDALPGAEAARLAASLQAGIAPALAKEGSERARALRAELVRHALSPASLESHDGGNAFCARPAAESAGGAAPVLVTAGFSPGDAGNAAALFAMARLVQDFKPELRRPVWFCAVARGSAPSAMKRIAQGLQGAAPAAHIVLAGASDEARGNLLGRALRSYAFTAAGMEWPGEDLGRRVRAAAEQAREAMAGARHAWSRDKKAPWAGLRLSPVQCETSSLWGGLQPVCRFDAEALSRSRLAVSEVTDAAYAAGQAALERFNAAPGGGKAPAVKASVPRSAVSDPALMPHGHPLLQDWSGSCERPAAPAAFASSRFVYEESAAASPAAPALIISAAGGPGEDEGAVRRRFARAARTVVSAALR
ncbi:MAG: hypothetical protein HUK26_02195 [Duodenibacillus sp.]|nr:hypothetical protein [Duodenibacillus sp.]